MRPFLWFFTVPILGALLLATACGPKGAEDASGTPTVVPTPADFAAIRDVDFTTATATVELLDRLGSGRVAQREVVYVDVTGDMREDAIVPITSDGTIGNIAYLVFTLRSGHSQLILTRTMDRGTASGLVLSIDDFGSLRETVGVYGAEDPLCCPSELRLTTFRWDGAALQVAGEQRVESPNKAKD